MLETPAKSPFKSLGAIGAAGAIAVSALGAAGFSIVPVNTGFGAKADALATLAFAGLALYGRLRATQKLTTASPETASTQPG